MTPSIPNGRYMIGSTDGRGNVSFSASPKLHFDQQTAENEVKRLAVVNPGKEFIIVKVVRSALLPTQQVVLS